MESSDDEARSLLGEFLHDGRRPLAAGLVLALLCFAADVAIARFWPMDFSPWPQAALLLNGLCTYIGLPLAIGLITVGLFRIK
ncbi:MULTISPECIES: hypothetical protein [unclassified Pseudactinotalea]|uniref:hypothetical protein n=1 Tax=unclassified Pseudactinotalea TaxID=2649176 RepID=UPI00128B21A4|nr:MULTISPECIES: hypothetical protein [unclassified Pseudactinotalea]MPV48852.1 hypothetical protein [Pseudactinotalea sp. HY160]QGH68829.1 hypothetical protein GCE65_04445 [Pseudactinotalea sp. HY158]